MTFLVVVMGASSSGKSTLGADLALALGVPFVDADDLHPPANVATMTAGTSLTDDDRWPWLRVVGLRLAAAETTGLVVACSALRRSYREAILAEAPASRFVMLDVPEVILAERMRARGGHFMPATLLASQLATLEPLETDEPGITVGPELSAAKVARLVAAELL
jgi:gluconokinase